jgi:hypothetical protein
MSNTGCLERTIPLLKNEELLCWFDAGLFALFHKRRPELDNFLKEENFKEFPEVLKYLLDFYNHFSAKEILPNLRTTLIEFRNNTQVNTYFIVKSSLGELEGFSIKTNTGDDPGEFYKGLFNRNLLQTVNIISQKTEENKQSSFFQMYANQWRILDIKLGILFEQPELSIASNSKLISEDKPITQCTNDTYTIIINKQGETEYTINTDFLETITIPIINTNTNEREREIQIFYLDSVIVHTGGYHYVVFVRCSNSNEWLYYNDQSITELSTLGSKDVLSSFQEMRSFILPEYNTETHNNKQIKPNTHAIYLIYSREPTN